jgi:mannose-6-phosphate isomerase-like protein (cupin superfamily)
MKYKIDFNSVQWESPMVGIRHKVFPFGERRLRLVEYSQSMKPHWCERGHTGYILEGRFQIEFDDGVRVFNAGDGVVIPDGSDDKHRATVLSEIVRAIFVEDA